MSEGPKISYAIAAFSQLQKCGTWRYLQVLMLIQGSVHLVHLASVTWTPPVLKLHLTCVPVTRPAATGVNAIQVSPVMDWTAQVRCFSAAEVKNCDQKDNAFLTFSASLRDGVNVQKQSDGTCQYWCPQWLWSVLLPVDSMIVRFVMSLFAKTATHNLQSYRWNRYKNRNWAYHKCIIIQYKVKYIKQTKILENEIKRVLTSIIYRGSKFIIYKITFKRTWSLSNAVCFKYVKYLTTNTAKVGHVTPSRPPLT